MTTPLTKGELRVIADTDHVQCGDAAAMAKMLLKVMDSEPVGITDRSEIEGLRRGEMANVMPPDYAGVDAGDEVYVYAAPQPAPVIPETLPCTVELKPGLIIGRGCKTETLLTALQRRADYYAEIDAMTPEERAEHNANIEAFKAMLPQQTPIAPDAAIDTLALDAATDIMEVIASSREVPLPGGDAQMLARIQCRIAEACRIMVRR